MNTFLHGTLFEMVYIKQPPCFVNSQNPSHICLFHKALYGLKYAPYQWFATLSSNLQNFGITQSQANPSLNTLQTHTIIIYFLVYVDDILLTSNDPQTISQLLQKLHHYFNMKDLGYLSHFLRVKAIKLLNATLLHHEQYTLDIFHQVGMNNCHALATLMAIKPSIIEFDTQRYSYPTWCRQLVGSLQYPTITRPDLSFSINHLRQQMHNPLNMHFQQLK